MKKLILLLFAIAPFFLFAQAGNFTLKGKIGHFNAPVKVYLKYAALDKEVLDSCTLKDGGFSFAGTLDSYTDALLMIDYKGTGLNNYKRTNYAMLVYLEKADIIVRSKDSLNHAVISGSALNSENTRYTALSAPQSAYISDMIRTYSKLEESAQPDTALMKKMEVKIDSAFDEKKAILRKYVKENPDSYFSLLTLKGLDSYNDPAVSLPPFKKLTQRIQNTPAGKAFKASLDKAAKVGEGNYAPDFVQNDVDGKPVSLSSFKGKYVLLDFWASWCAPCRAETPNVVKAYNQYKDKNFTVLSVSIDMPAEKKAWTEAIAKDRMTWTNVLSPYNNEAAKLYNILAIPSNFLIDPTGKIIGHNLTGKKLTDALAKVMKK